MFQIIRDEREKKPWDFTSFGQKTKKETLPTGDYTIRGYETDIIIERKASTGEVAANIGSKKRQFVSELERMQLFKHRCIICEFTMEDILRFPEGSTIPRKLWPKLRIHANYLLAFIRNFKLVYDIDFFLCSSRLEAEQAAFNFLRESYETITSGR